MMMIRNLEKVVLVLFTEGDICTADHVGVLADDVAIVAAGGGSKDRCKTWLPRQVWGC